VVLGLDARDGMVAVRGWLDTSTLSAVAVARRHAGLPLAAIVYTDIATDGTLSGPNIAALEEMLAASSVPVIASGGIATLDDIRRVASIGCTGCIVGRALYDEAFTLPDAVAAAADA
jgi:phosphoribosylformimino-5-aminoimidazole carboxamide ribotide isomerase